MNADTDWSISTISKLFDAEAEASNNGQQNVVHSFTKFRELPLELQKRIMCSMDNEDMERCLLAGKHFHTLIDSCVSKCKNYSQVSFEFQRGTCVVMIENRHGTLCRLFWDPVRCPHRPERKHFRKGKWTRVIEHPQAMDLLLGYVTAMCGNAWIQSVDIEIWDDGNATLHYEPVRGRNWTSPPETEAIQPVRYHSNDGAVHRLAMALRNHSWVTRIQFVGKALSFMPEALCSLKFERMDIKKMVIADEQPINTILHEWLNGQRDIYSLGIDFNDSSECKRLDVDKVFEGLTPILMRVERDRHETTDKDTYFSYRQYRLRRARQLLFIRLFPFRIMCWVP